jgi:hypothetical protein
MQVHDMILWTDVPFGHNRLWLVKSVCLGGMHTESLVELQSLTEQPGTDTEGRKHGTTWVPEPLLRSVEIYRRVDYRAVIERVFARVASEVRNAE